MRVFADDYVCAKPVMPNTSKIVAEFLTTPKQRYQLSHGTTTASLTKGHMENLMKQLKLELSIQNTTPVSML